MRIYGYLRASTEDQDASRAKTQLEEFSRSLGKETTAFFIENESGAKLDRPELFRLLDIAAPGDVLLVEQVDRISRLNQEDWETLKTIIREKVIRVVSLDLPTSHQILKTNDEFTERMMDAINSMMLDMLAAIARKDYLDRRRRQADGIKMAKAQGKYKGRQIDTEKHRKIALLLNEGKSYSDIQDLLGCSRHTISKVKKRLQSQQSEM